MVRNSTRKFNVPSNEHNWVQKWCVYVHNIALSKKLDWRMSLEVGEGFTKEISKFCFQKWEPVWYFKKSKSPENLWKIQIIQDTKCVITPGQRGRNPDISFGQ